MMSKLQIISDKNKKSSKIKLLLLKKLNKSKVIILNTIIVIGRHKGLKILAACGVPVRVWPRAPLNER